MKSQLIGIIIRRHLAFLALILGLAGCAGVPAEPAVPRASKEAGAPETGRSRAEGFIRMAQNAIQSGDVSTAAGLYEQALLANGSSLTATLGLGHALLMLGRYREASEAFERALKAPLVSPDAHYGYARAMLALRRPDVAVEHLRKARSARPDDPVILNALGVAYDLLGQHDRAASTYRLGLALDPTSVSLRNNLGLSLALQNDFDDALATLGPLAEGPGGGRRTRQNLALVYGLKGDLAAAERLSRMDLGEAEVRNNIAFFTAARGLPSSSDRAAALHRAPAELLLEAGKDRHSCSNNACP